MIETTDSLLAHVSYIVDPEKLKALAGTDWEFLLSPLYDSFYLTLIIVTLVVVVGCFMTESWYARCVILAGAYTTGC